MLAWISSDFKNHNYLRVYTGLESSSLICIMIIERVGFNQRQLI